MKIIAIGGGRIGRFSSTVRTTPLDREIVRISGKKSPRLLFLPTASAGCDEYCAAIYKQFSKRLGCKVDILLLVNTDPERARIRDRIAWADIVYVGEGNTLRMMKTWRRHGVDRALRSAMKRFAECTVSVTSSAVPPAERFAVDFRRMIRSRSTTSSLRVPTASCGATTIPTTRELSQ